MKLLFRKKAQDMHGMDVAPWAKLFHTSEEKVNWIVSIHRLLHCLPPNHKSNPEEGQSSAPEQGLYFAPVYWI